MQFRDHGRAECSDARRLNNELIGEPYVCWMAVLRREKERERTIEEHEEYADNPSENL